MLWESFKFAWRGSFSRSGAWAPLVGALIIMPLFWIGGIGMILPATIPGGIAFFLMCAGAAWILIFLGQFFYAPYSFLKDSRSELSALKKDGPCLECSFNGTAYGGVSPQVPNSYPVIMLLTVINSGTKPSIAKDWAAYLEFRGQTHRGYFIYGAENTTMHMVDGSKFSVPDSEMIIKKTSTPIAVGAMTQGYFAVVFHDIKEDAFRLGAKVIVKFKDVHSKEYSVETVHDASLPRSLGYMPQMRVGQ